MALSGKTAVIFGYNGEIAKSICKRFSEEGCNIVVSDLKKENVDLASSDLRNVTALVADVRSHRDVQRVVETAIEKYKKIDIVVNCSRIAILKEVVDLSEDEWDTIINFNAKSMYYIAKAVLKNMMENNSGKIIGVASKAANSGPPNLSAYAASMNAMIGFLRSLSCEVRDNNIRVNAVCPGYVEHEELVLGAELTNNQPPEEDVYIQFTPFLDATKEPKAIANLVAFLAKEDGDLINGQVYSSWDDEITYWRNLGVEAEFF